MAKIHTHYDNLKVARQAPQEVIRAAYKALSQKYHPDKNPGDEKAARIMAIVNTAYTTLSDPQRRKEHDEWIAAEEWEIAWLESTHHEDGHREHHEAGAWSPRPVAPRAASRLKRAGWWMALASCFAAGGLAGALIVSQPRLMPSALASAVSALPEAKADVRVVAKLAPHPEADNWAVGKASLPDTALQKPPEVKVLAVTQLVVPARAPDCDSALHTLVAPNGENWPAQSGYVDGYPVGAKGEEMQLLVDNSDNGSPVFVKVYDLERRNNVRHLFVMAHDKLTVDKLAAGRYELRYQNLDLGADAAACPSRKTDIAISDSAAHRDAE